MSFRFFLPASKTDKLLGDNAFQNQSVELISADRPLKLKLMPSNDEFP